MHTRATLAVRLVTRVTRVTRVDIPKTLKVSKYLGKLWHYGKFSVFTRLFL